MEGAFPHLKIMSDMMREADKRGSSVNFGDIPPHRLTARPFRRPDFSDEWRLLKKVWTLHRNGKDKLSRGQVEAGSSRYYSDDPLSDLADWVWRFVMMVGGSHYAVVFENAFKAVRSLFADPRFSDLLTYYDAEMSPVRAARYLDTMKAFFAAYSEFSQVYFQVSAGLEPDAGHRASSADFDAVRMFYGNTFEVFASSVDILAYVNNLQSGRVFSQFSQLSQAEYLKLDKANRFNAFALNAPFMALCQEVDNQIRNASHHGSFQFDPHSQVITYRTGKGGTGPEQKMSYVEYLTRFTRLFLQFMTLLRIEMLMCHMMNARKPI